MTTHNEPYFPALEQVAFVGVDSDAPFGFRHYDPKRVVLGKTMADHLRPAVCYWHTFCWPGADVFGDETFDRPWLGSGDPIALAERKMDVAFEFVRKLGLPFYTFHDRDLAPEGTNFAQSHANLQRMVDRALGLQAQTGISLLWGTANLTANRRYAAGAATNPDPEVFAYAAAQVKAMLEATHKLGGHNYVLWGGREGYDTLLNTDLARESAQLGRFMQMVVEHKHKIGFTGTILIEPKPMEPAKHQYDFDSATVHAFLQRYGLEKEIKVNIEVNHATLAGHSFDHELAYAIANGIFGSVDINRGDPQLGWDTDQFPNSVEDATRAMWLILQGGGFTTGGMNFDARLRRQSMDKYDLFHAHIGGLDTLARGLLNAAKIIEDGALQAARDARYAGWNQPLGTAILGQTHSLETLSHLVLERDLNPAPVSGRQEWYENLLNRYL